MSRSRIPHNTILALDGKELKSVNIKAKDTVTSGATLPLREGGDADGEVSAPATLFRRARRRITFLLVVGLLITAAAPATGAPDIRSLLEALWIDIPAQPMVAPPFSLRDLGGAPVRLADLRGRIVMLYFWTTW